ncbi:NEL-type E3 ubiquitin ligase domain-containing protein [Pseudomonas putida]|uniref:RING-type E3 ubiquitin transferase n=1 Tax=Pseudomonas putida TaxID=303 RepID=A0A177SCA5_PSEPU|nr:NEL-type E3 ubiquitin ligase domain-containing protein [Pseudomonas putida]OAI86098.1 hypothetical protein AYO28_25390 [Pseudomonas putida]
MSDTATPDIHYQTVSRRVPQHLVQGPAQQRKALRSSLPGPLPWLLAARAGLPGVLAALQDEQQRHQALAAEVEGFLAQVPDAAAFAEPLLREALRSSLGLDLDVRRTFLFNAVRARADESRLSGSDPVVRAFQMVKVATQPLLLAALQNFEAFEAEPDGLRDDRRPSLIFASDSGEVLAPSQPIDLLPERFAGLCRTLDLGARYQRVIEGVFRPLPKEGETVEGAARDRREVFRRFERSTLLLTLHLARLRSWIDQALYENLLGRVNDGSPASSLALWEVELNGVVLFPCADALVVFMPDEPRQPLQVFKTLDELQASLRERLKDPAWRNYFLRFVPARERTGLLRRIQAHLYPKVWNPGGWYEEQFDPSASIGLGSKAMDSPLLDFLLQRKIAVLKDDGLFHAVPTAVEDHKSLEDKVSYFLGVGLNVLNVAAFVVPGLGLVMLGVNAALLGYEVYEGFDSLSRGEREEAWGYFMDVAENLAIIAALGAAGAVAGRFEGNLPLAVRSMRPVTLADGSVRLWKPDLRPFAYDVELPAGLQPGDNGLYHWGGRQWLQLDGRYYSVRTLLGSETGYVLEHPTQADAWQLPVRHNDNGGWLHELDTPQHWRGEELFRRAGVLEAQVSAAMAQRALRISGVSEAQLRRSLMDSRRPPALLSDSLLRLAVADALGEFPLGDVASLPDSLQSELFAHAYGEGQVELAPAGTVLKQQFDSLPRRVIEEILGAATEAEIHEINASARVPLRIAEEARLYQQQVRIARACEALYMDVEANPDGASLLLHGLAQLADWPAHLRMAVHEDALDGRLLAQIGAGDATEIAVVWRRQLPRDFCRTLFEAIPQASRDNLGLTDAGALRARLQEQPLPPRQRLRQWLGMQPVKPGFRSPLRLADGRIGYPLSGRGDPFFTEDELLDKLRLLELDDIYPEDALQALYRAGLDRAAIAARLHQVLDEMQALREYLDRWALDSAHQTFSEARQRSRARIGEALWAHWRGNVLPELGRQPAALALYRVQLADLPAQLPSFIHQRVATLLLNEVMLQEGSAQERVIGERTVQRLARQFPAVTRLDIRGGVWDTGMVQQVARAWPELVSLGLRELVATLGYTDLLTLRRMPRLRWLELRGSRVVEMSLPVMEGVSLEYLGMDWMELHLWPRWLNSATLSGIGNVSLTGNRLTGLPVEILEEIGSASGRLTRVVLRDNPLGCQALLDLRVAEYFRNRFAFDLGVPPALMDELNLRVNERAQLQMLLQTWSDNPAPSTVAGYRSRIARLLIGYWRESLYSPTAALLYLEDVNLADFPDNLPAFFVGRVRRLELVRFDASGRSLEHFLAPLRNLTELSLVGGQPALPAVPGFLGNHPQLHTLALVRMGMTIDQEAMDAFGRLPRLSSLQLDGNRLGAIQDVSMFHERFFDYLGMANMGIAVWPQWLNELLPRNIELLGLDDNQLVELPIQLLENRYVADGAVDISLRNNPLSRATLIQAYRSQHANRPYSLTMDVPEDIAAMDARRHSSDSEISDPLSDETGSLEDEPSSAWLTGDASADAHNQQTWAGLASQGDAEALLRLVMRLQHSADYRAPGTRAELVARVWTVLAAASQDAQLRQTLNGMAEEPLQQLHNHDTCPDGIRLEFNQMELLVHTRQALRDMPEANRGPALFRLMRGAFRAQTLDRIARERARGRDEAEVRLAYRLRWGEQLELPLPPRAMLYRSEADLAPGELEQALNQVLLEERGAGLSAFAADCDFWVAYLREAFAERFRLLKDAYEQSVLEVTDLYPDDNPDQVAERIRALEDRFKRDERALLESLTLEQAMLAR